MNTNWMTSKVFKTESPDELEVETITKPKSASEPPPPKNVIERKTSSSGRFVITTEDLDGLADSKDDGHERSQDGEAFVENGVVSYDKVSGEAPMQRFKGVHFSVGDKDQNDDRKREQAETNTTINLKSWR
ncbi:unnamed protein product [Strongylus vulgaris]|uniref:Uncharacterized protein n=1 Tax=Strongylus vulgaris TaxID=40348 RepID=A0A3P7J1Z2_STRVU|nr:unnamed protein product [Strongylus vulgaris]